MDKKHLKSTNYMNGYEILKLKRWEADLPGSTGALAGAPARLFDGITASYWYETQQ